jgi:hypothetical protein
VRDCRVVLPPAANRASPWGERGSALAGAPIDTPAQVAAVRAGGSIPEGAVGAVAVAVVVLAQVLDQDPGFVQTREQLDTEQLVADARAEVLDVGASPKPSTPPAALCPPSIRSASRDLRTICNRSAPRPPHGNARTQCIADRFTQRA